MSWWCSRCRGSSSSGTAQTYIGGRFSERAVSWTRLWSHGQSHARGLLQQVLREGAERQTDWSCKQRLHFSSSLGELLRPAVSLLDDYFHFVCLIICLLEYSSILCHQRAPKSRPMATLSQVQCRRSGCKNVSPGCTDLCPDCLNRGGQREGRRAHAPKEKSKQRCRTQGCDHYANQEKQGYCNECDHFKQIYRGWCFLFPKRGLESLHADVRESSPTRNLTANWATCFWVPAVV